MICKKTTLQTAINVCGTQNMPIHWLNVLCCLLSSDCWAELFTKLFTELYPISNLISSCDPESGMLQNSLLHSYLYAGVEHVVWGGVVAIVSFRPRADPPSSSESLRLARIAVFSSKAFASYTKVEVGPCVLIVFYINVPCTRLRICLIHVVMTNKCKAGFKNS